jgi:hypothetical protein
VIENAVACLAGKYGQDLNVRLYDVSKPEQREQFRGVLATARDNFWPYPIILVDDEVWMVGRIDYCALERVIREKIAAVGRDSGGAKSA